MRKTLMLGTVLAAIMAMVPIAALAQSGEDNGQSYARLSFVQGAVSVDRGSELGTESGEVNLPVVEGNKLVTGDGEAEVQFGRRNFLRLGTSSEAEFAALPGSSDNHVKIHVRAGQAYLRVTTLEGEKSIEVHTPDASFYILEEGLYRFDVGQGDSTEILVHEGSAEAASEGGSVVVQANERLVAANGELQSDPESFNAAMDGFDRWNETRDGLFNRPVETSYLPSSISEYEGELNDNGRWVREESYGNVWVPYIQNDGWRPYLYGRWVWYPIIGWTWVSSEPWGWSTYHYGRWQWMSAMGWYWIPTTHWGPAWVQWYGGRDYYGWCPLSYYDRPGCILDGRYNDRWHGDNYPWNSRALTMVHRDRLQSPAISRHALRSSELGALGRTSLRAGQPNVRPVIGRSGLASPVSARTLSGTGSRTTITERGSLSKGTLRSPASGGLSGINSRSRTSVSTGSLSGSVSGSISKLRTYPSRDGAATSSGTARSSLLGKIRSNGVVERPSGVSSKSSSGGIRTYVPNSSIRSSSRSVKSSASGTAKGYPSIIRNKSTSASSLRGSGSVHQYSPSPSVRSYSSRSSSSGSLSRSTGSTSGSGNSRVTSTPRSYSSRDSIRSYTAPSNSSRSSLSGSLSRSSGSSSSRSYSAPRSSTRSYSYSAPSYSGRSSSSGSSYSRVTSTPRSYSYSTPSRSGGSYSSGSPSRSSGSYSRSSSSRSYSAPSSSSSSKGSVSSSSRSSSSSHSSSSSRSSSSSGHSGSIRRK